MIVLASDAVHRKNEFLHLSKTYEATIVLGLQTDTYDCLGVLESNEAPVVMPSPNIIAESLKSFMGTFVQSYPPYSSKTINGKQLHQIARSGFLDLNQLPNHLVTVSDIWDISQSSVLVPDLVSDINSMITAVSGDFRQAHIQSVWESFAQAHPSTTLPTLTFKITVSGGTYIRSIAQELGQNLGCGACLFKLKRTQIGEYSLENKDF